MVITQSMSMKVKILLVPLFIVMSIALLVWLVYPAYSNGSDGFKDKWDALNNEKAKLADVQKKNETVTALYSQISSNKDKSDTLYRYIPEAIKEEEIIDNLNFMASNAGVTVASLSVAQPELNTNKNTTANMRGEELSDNSSAEDNTNYTPKTQDFKVTYSVTGNYEQIKDLIGKLSSFERFDGMDSLSIKKPQSDANSKGDALQADMAINFNFLKKFNQTKLSVDDGIFALSSFNLKPITDIETKKNVDVLKLNIDNIGRSNPFLP